MAKKIQRSALVPFSAQQMFDLVNDIENYPQFMQGCVAAKILQRSDRQLEARLDLQKGSFSQSFVTRNALNAPNTITMNLVEGPFKMLQGLWQFQTLGDQGCKVSLDLEFEFKNKLMALAAGSWFETVANQLVDSVCQRAHKLYVVK